MLALSSSLSLIPLPITRFQLALSSSATSFTRILLCLSFCLRSVSNGDLSSMASVSSEDASDQQSDRCGSYSLSADVSESESCGSFSCRRFEAEGASTSVTLSPRPIAAPHFGFPAAQVMLPVIGGKDVVIRDAKPDKRDADLSGTHFHFFFFFLG